MPFSAKFIKMPLVSPMFNQRPKRGPESHKTMFFMVLLQTQVPQIFLATLTKFDLVDSKLTPRKPNFDQAVRTG